MPTVEDVLAQVLAGAVGADVRVRPDVAPESDAPPYVVYSQFAGGRVQSLSGDSGLANPRFQVDVYSRKRSQTTDLKNSVRAAVLADEALGAVLVEERSTFEPETKLFRHRMDFSIWFND